MMGLILLCFAGSLHFLPLQATQFVLFDNSKWLLEKQFVLSVYGKHGVKMMI